MSATSRVAVLLEPGRLELREEARPTPQAGELVVRVRAALTDGTDLKTYRRGHPQMPTPTRFGHEFSGDVAAAGEGVTAFAPGDAVMCVHTAPCRACFWCAQGEEELCERLMSTMVLGAYADYVTLPQALVAQNCFHKPADLSYREAAFLEPLSCVVHSLETARPQGSVAIVGDGAFGLLHALVLRERGVDAIVIGRRAERLERARSYGFDPVDARAADPVRVVRERTGGRGADAVIECTGTQSAWEEAPSLVRRGGTVSLFGGLAAGSRVSFEAARLHYDEVRVRSPFHFTPRAVRDARYLLVERRIDVGPLITHTYPLHEIASAFARLDSGEGMKACIEP
ncbi:MAG TPA: alcohol dehydrogenase catalytic domain-containing protein [Candidatus Dormibacteraeota bacterium]|nr:alcohol dehydrogenase catalytic domain-containing protein [Candidatus Dormibacteraeota bacterium]